MRTPKPLAKAISARGRRRDACVVGVENYDNVGGVTAQQRCVVGS